MLTIYENQLVAYDKDGNAYPLPYFANHSFDDFYTKEEIDAMVDYPDLNGATISISSNLGTKITAQKGKKILVTEIERRLPIEYQEVEYIQSNGSQWIDLGFKAKGTDEFDMVCEFPNPSSGWSSFFGYWGSNEVCYGIWGKNTTTLTMYYGSSSVDVSFNSSQKLNISYKEKKFIVNSNQATTNPSTATTSQNIRLFKMNTTYGGQPAKFYSLKYYKDKELYRDYVPCYRKTDNVAGIYDLITKTFLTNGGSGTFSKGADVTSGTANITIKYSGTWDVTAEKDGETPIPEIVNVVEDGKIYKLNMFF